MKSLILTFISALLLGATAASCRPSVALADPQPEAAAPADADSARAQRQAQRDAARAERDAARTAQESTELEAQLEKARRQLEAAARQVAELSTQLSQPVIEKFMTFADEPGRAIIGVQLAAGGRVREVSPGGPAAEAGIHVGDVIVALNGTDVKGENASREVRRLMQDVKPESKVIVRVLRDGRTREFTVTARPGLGLYLAHGGGIGPGPEVLPDVRGAWMLRGGAFTDMELATLTPQLGRYFGIDRGVLVVRAPSEGALKLQDGDVIVSIDGREPKSGSHATRILGSYQPGEKVSLHVMRDHKPLDLQGTVPERGPGNAMWRTVPLPPLPAVPAQPPQSPQPPQAMIQHGDST